MPACAFVVPVDDLFYSAVTRDPFPDPSWRAFAFHFRAGSTRDEQLRRMSEVLRIAPSELGTPIEQRLTLPSPGAGHAELVATIDRCLRGTGLALTGNYFDGLAIEDCVQRSLSEWKRLG
jgi:UDP-galactopyranose mutase